MKKILLEKDEKDILDALEKGDLKPVPNVKSRIKKHAGYAQATNRKDKRVNIRISSKDLDSIQRKALEEGIPYQTLISSLLHKYTNGRLVEKKAR